jgi:2-dehydro-3-deoxyphosphooctonate aldolase (KDO 8-P synthase)
VAAGVDGIFMEVHPEPDKALSDGPNMMPLGEVQAILNTIRKVYDAVWGS